MASTSRRLYTLLILAGALVLASAGAAAHDRPQKRTLSLSATGAVKTTPDKVDITAGVTVEALTARDALDKNSTSMADVVEALKADGIEARDIQTTNFSVQPVYEQRKQGKAPFIVGYRVINSVRIAVRDTAKLGATLDKVVGLGANTIDSIQFGVSEPEAIEDAARKDAMKKVTDNAKLYAEAAGVELGPILTISEEQGHIPRRYADMAVRMEAAAPPVPIEAGTHTVEIRLSVTWELN